MKPPLFIRPLQGEERSALEAGLRSKNAFTLRRCQRLLASAQSQRAASIAAVVGCADQTVRNVLHAFSERGWDCLNEQSHAPRTNQPVLSEPTRSFCGQ